MAKATQFHASVKSPLEHLGISQLVVLIRGPHAGMAAAASAEAARRARHGVARERSGELGPRLKSLRLQADRHRADRDRLDALYQQLRHDDRARARRLGPSEPRLMLRRHDGHREVRSAPSSAQGKKPDGKGDGEPPPSDPDPEAIAPAGAPVSP